MLKRFAFNKPMVEKKVRKREKERERETDKRVHEIKSEKEKKERHRVILRGKRRIFKRPHTHSQPPHRANGDLVLMVYNESFLRACSTCVCVCVFVFECVFELKYQIGTGLGVYYSTNIEDKRHF